MEAASLEGTPLCVGLLDINKAYDSVSHKAAITAWETTGMGYNKFFTQYIGGNSTQIRTPHGKSAPIQLTKGLQQGGMESPFLFDLVMIHALRRANRCGKKEQHVQSCADDLALWAPDAGTLQIMITQLETDLRPCGLSISHTAKKSKSETIWINCEPTQI